MTRTLRRPARTGFSLIELLVSLALVALVLGGAMTMFNYTNRLSRSQLHQSDLQQSGRVAQRELLRTVRMAGRGGLSGFAVAGQNANSFPASITPALSIRNNTPSINQRIAVGNAGSPLVKLRTDVLTVRGHFNSPPLFVDSTNPATFNSNPGVGGSVIIDSHIAGDVMQDMTAIIEAVNANRRDAVVVVSNLTDEIYGVAELDPANSVVPNPYTPDPNNPIQITIAYRVTGGNAPLMVQLSADGVFPDAALPHPAWLPPRDLAGVGMVALLEEYRYYIREPGPTEGDLPRLSRGRFFPGTEIPHPDGGWSSDLADSVYDLQVALGFDSSFDGTDSSNGFFDFDFDNTGPDDIIFDADFEPTGSGENDDWLFNDTGDTAALPNLPWSPLSASDPDPPRWTASQPRPQLFYARVTTLAMAARPDSGYQAPEIDRVEDNVYPGDASDDVNDLDGRSRRRLMLTTIADLRNL